MCNFKICALLSNKSLLIPGVIYAPYTKSADLFNLLLKILLNVKLIEMIPNYDLAYLLTALAH